MLFTNIPAIAATPIPTNPNTPASPVWGLDGLVVPFWFVLSFISFSISLTKAFTSSTVAPFTSNIATNCSVLALGLYILTVVFPSSSFTFNVYPAFIALVNASFKFSFLTYTFTTDSLPPWLLLSVSVCVLLYDKS